MYEPFTPPKALLKNDSHSHWLQEEKITDFSPILGAKKKQKSALNRAFFNPPLKFKADWKHWVSKESERVRKSGFRLFSDSFETPGRILSVLLGPCPGVLFPDCFRTLPGFRARRARETLCGAGPIARLDNHNRQNHQDPGPADLLEPGRTP